MIWFSIISILLTGCKSGDNSNVSAVFSTPSPIWAGTSLEDQSEEEGDFGYDLAKENFDFSRYKKSWFDISCQFKPTSDTPWFHVVNKNGSLVPPAAHNRYCDNTVFQTERDAIEQYLLIGYTPRVTGSRDQSGIKKNFAVMLHGSMRQNIGDNANQQISTKFKVDGYIFDHRVSGIIGSLAKGRGLVGIDKLCAYINKAGQAVAEAQTINEVLDGYVKNGGNTTAMSGAGFWDHFRQLNIEGFRNQIVPLCRFEKGEAFDIQASVSNFGPDLFDSRSIGNLKVYSFGRGLYSGGLKVSQNRVKTSLKACRYVNFSPELQVENEVVPAIGAMGGVRLGSSGKVCFDSYLQTELPRVLGSTNDCGGKGSANCLPDHATSLIASPDVNVSISASVEGGVGLGSVVGAKSTLGGSLELVDFEQSASASMRYTRSSDDQKWIITSVDYEHALHALRGNLSFSISAGLDDRLDIIYDSIVGIIRQFDRFSKMADTFGQFKKKYLRKDWHYPLVQFPKSLSWKAYAHTNPTVLVEEPNAREGFTQIKDGCSCYRSLADLVESRRVLIHTIECLADHADNVEKSRSLATEKSAHSKLFGDLDNFCNSKLEDQRCEGLALFQNRKNKLFYESSTRKKCDPGDLPKLFEDSVE
ncbi:MAG: hypothetical protein FJ146_08600 [Deltaproteobacteria bacterium]|nr:hypothetical protein [Deltaproteobacteria bacterium]